MTTMRSYTDKKRQCRDHGWEDESHVEIIDATHYKAAGRKKRKKDAHGVADVKLNAKNVSQKVNHGVACSMKAKGKHCTDAISRRQ